MFGVCSILSVFSGMYDAAASDERGPERDAEAGEVRRAQSAAGGRQRRRRGVHRQAAGPWRRPPRRAPLPRPGLDPPGEHLRRRGQAALRQAVPLAVCRPAHPHAAGGRDTSAAPVRNQALVGTPPGRHACYPLQLQLLSGLSYGQVGFRRSAVNAPLYVLAVLKVLIDFFKRL